MCSKAGAECGELTHSSDVTAESGTSADIVDDVAGVPRFADSCLSGFVHVPAHIPSALGAEAAALNEHTSKLAPIPSLFKNEPCVRQ